jgi:ankyrin repeat protein
MRKLTEFQKAIESGDVAQVVAFVEGDPQLLEARVSRNLRPVLLAAYYRQPAVVEALLARGAGVDACLCAVLGRAQQLREIVAADPSALTTHSPDGWTLLHLAARFDQVAATEVLLDLGADLHDASNDKGMAPIHQAWSREMIVLLLSRGADINVRTIDGLTLLHSHATHASGELIQFLLDHGADPHAKTKANQTPWAIAVEQGNREAADILFRGAQADDSGPVAGP